MRRGEIALQPLDLLPLLVKRAPGCSQRGFRSLLRSECGCSFAVRENGFLLQAFYFALRQFQVPREPFGSFLALLKGPPLKNRGVCDHTRRQAGVSTCDQLMLLASKGLRRLTGSRGCIGFLKRSILRRLEIDRRRCSRSSALDGRDGTHVEATSGLQPIVNQFCQVILTQTRSHYLPNDRKMQRPGRIDRKGTVELRARDARAEDAPPGNIHLNSVLRAEPVVSP